MDCGKQIFPLADVIHGVNVSAVMDNAEMQVRTGGTTGGSHITDDLASLHLLTQLHSVMGHVHVGAGIAVTMINGNINGKYITLS